MVTEEFNSILKQYEKHKLETYKVLELLGDDYTFNDFGADTENRRYIALLQCGTFLGFDKEQVNNKSCTGTVYHLKSANFCRQRLCPMCQFRKAEKMYQYFESGRVFAKLFPVSSYGVNHSERSGRCRARKRY